MKKQLFNLRALLMLCMIFVIGGGSVAFAAEGDEFYSLTAVQNKNNTSYTTDYDVTIANLKWGVPGNQNFDGYWRIGGKSLTNVDRYITGKSPIGKAIGKVTLNHNGKSNASLTINSISLTVASDASFTNIIETVTKESPNISVSTAGSIDFEPSNGAWAENSYYKLTINVSNNNTKKNYGLDFTSMVFYEGGTGSTPTATLTGISVSGDAADLWIGDDFTHEGITVTAKYDDNSEKDVTNSCTYSGYDMSTAGSQTVTVSYGGKEATYTVNVKTIGNTQENAYTASEAIALIDAGKDLKTPVYVKGKVSKIATAWTESNGYLSFWVSEDGKENKFEMFKNYKGADNAIYASEDECPKVGDDVICYGQLTKYKTTYELNAGNYLVEKTTVEDNRKATTVTFGSGVDDQTFDVNPGETFEGKTATVSPTEAGSVTYSSDNTDVASVDENTGAITIGTIAGKATITASFAATDTYKASSAKYYINVIDPNGPVFYETFDQNDGTGGNDGQWSGGIASNNLTTDNEGWINEKGNGANQCARFGIGSTLGSATTPAIDLSGDKKYTLTFKAGAWAGDKTTIDVVISEGELTYNGTSSSTQTITMANAAWTDYTMTIAGATNSTTITFTAKVASNNRFFLDEVKIVKAQAPATSTLSLVAVDNGIYYATFSSSEDVIFPSNVEIDAVSVEDSTLNITELTKNDYFVKATSADGFDVVSNGYYVPANTGVLIKSSENSVTYYNPYEAETVTLPANQLKPAPAEGDVFTAEKGYLYYKLAYNNYDEKTGLGFYWGAAGGGAFSVKPGTAYLAVPSTNETNNVKGFSFSGATTGIDATDAVEAEKIREIYTIAGQKVSTMSKPGLYIVNGKKTVIRK